MMKLIFISTLGWFLTLSAVMAASLSLDKVDRSSHDNVVKNNLRHLQESNFVELCRKNGTSTDIESYYTLKISSAYRNRIRGLLRRGLAFRGPCRENCASLCDHQACFEDFILANTTDGVESCTCAKKGSVVNDKCAGLPNTQCGYNETCACMYGFWGTNVTASGCPKQGFSVRDLPYDFDDLEPYIDARTMFLHHQRHHATYVANLNRALDGTPDILKPILDLQKDAIARGTTVRNNGGGHYNHALFWTIMTSPTSANKTKPSDQLQGLIDSSFVNTTNMIAQFNALAAPGSVFGSGWAWICVNEAGNKLILVGTPNQDNPLMAGVVNETMFPILGLDVWEHAYYLKYQNLRPDYVKAFWNLVNWDVVSNYTKYVIENKNGVSV